MHPAEGYVRDVVSGTVAAGRWVRLACERHLRDMEDGRERGLVFDAEAAQIAIDFFGLLKHYKGEWAGRVIRLEPWQQFILWSLFGWKREDGTRRFVVAYVEVARKNGKTTVAAGIGLYLMVADGEPGAEIYTAATKRDQARIAHRDAVQMVKASPDLRKLIGIHKDNLHILLTASKFEPLGRDANTADGLNIHGAIVDELHAHKTREMWDVLDTATGARRQPLILGITTAGTNRQSICWEQHEYAEKVLSGVVEDDTFFGIIFSLDLAETDSEGNVLAAGDDWQDESVWVKANPNLGVSKKWDDMRRKAAKAKETPSALNAFLQRELNIWVHGESRWLNPDRWRTCDGAVDADGLRGRTCYGGLDLANTTDIAAFVLVFPPQVEDEPYQILCRFFLPDEAIIERVHRDRVPYDAWVRQGFITVTPGAVIDYGHILAQIDEDAQKYDVAEIGFDRWGATKIQTELMDLGGQDWVVQIGQGYASMSAPTKELEKLILAGQLAHGGNPVLTWMADNVIVTRDAAGNIKPDKAKSREKIDGIVALIMALDRATRHMEASSVYDSRGLLEV